MASERLSLIYLSSSLIEKLLTSDPKDVQPGLLMGFFVDDKVVGIGCSYNKKLLPTGLQPVGAFCVCSNKDLTERECIAECEPVLRSQWQENREEELSLVLTVKRQSGEAKVESLLYNLEYGTISNPEVEIKSDSDLLSGFVIMRATGILSLPFQAAKDNDEFKENLSSSIDRLRAETKKGILAFRLKDSLALVTDDEEAKGTVGELVKMLESCSEDSRGKSKKRKLEFKEKEPLEFELMMKATNIPLEDNDRHAPVIDYHRNEFTSITIPLVFDFLALARLDISLPNAYRVLVQAYLNQLTMTQETLLRFKKGLELSTAVPYHCWPSLCAHPVTIAYPKDSGDDDLKSFRQTLHQNLLLPTDRPFLRKLNAHAFSTDLSKDVYLRNTHVGLPTSNEVGTQVAVVYGTYSYHHYMQDRMDDNGWGCAYRSLQTIVSWFRHQGYTDKSVPSHTEIQKVLVDIDDKPRNFIGSKLWIGSQEVSFVLNQWIEVTSKIMSVNSGAELANKGRELVVHFRQQGTPIMIGGGVLAHTILGVEFNEISGNIRFLILDPHYTGAEDLNVIQNKGWCGWKNSDFWDKGAFYNLCLPQRPDTF